MNLWNRVMKRKTEEKYACELREYWHKVNLSDGFDIEGIPKPQGMTGGLHSYDCQKPNLGPYSCPLVNNYARVGLHRYNLLEGTNFDLRSLVKYNLSMKQDKDTHDPDSFYLITLDAHDPVSCSQQTFQVRVDEHCHGSLDLPVSIARPKGATTNERFIPQKNYRAVDGLPDSFNDKKRFYVVEESELLGTYWIRMYLVLTVYTYNRRLSNRDLNKLKIVKAAIETEEDVEPPNEILINAKNVIINITFKGLAVGGIGEHVQRNVIVRRVIDEPTGYLSLKGELLTREEDLFNIRTREEIHYHFAEFCGL